jgi:hypothetical protein
MGFELFNGVSRAEGTVYSLMYSKFVDEVEYDPKSPSSIKEMRDALATLKFPLDLMETNDVSAWAALGDLIDEFR